MRRNIETRHFFMLALCACLVTACSDAKPLITVDAGPDQQVEAGSRGTLLAKGNINGARVYRFYWTQLEGPATEMRRPNRTVARFVAPDITQPTPLVFELSASDRRGNSATDTVTVTVVPKK